MKLKTIYICQNCQFETGKWQGKCQECNEWNSFVEDVVETGTSKNPASSGIPAIALETSKFSSTSVVREKIKTDIGELDQVLGGGIVKGSLILLAGEPGIGKSTLTLQVVDKIAEKKEKVLYITGEESVEQVSDRAHRLNCKKDNIHLLYETGLERIIPTIEKEKPDLLVLDSIQVMSSDEISGSAGTLSQVRYVTEKVMNIIKTLGIPTLLIGHVNKDGNIAGPKVLEHLVDTVLLIEGERDRELRMLRALKNRFGPVNEVGIFEMTGAGLMEVKNPAQRVLDSRPKEAPGTCLTMTIQGNRPLLMEVQALVSRNSFGYPKRTAGGYDKNRLELLLAVLQKHTNLNLSEHDVYINIVGGLYLSDPGADLAICLAIASSLLQRQLPRELVAFGEIGLTGEIRTPIRYDERNKASEKIGLKSTGKITELRTALNLLTK